MIIVLIFLLLLLPIKLNMKIIFVPTQNNFHVKIFLYKLQLFKIYFFLYNDKLYYQFSKSKPRELKIDFPFNTTQKRKFNFVILEKIDVFSYFGVENAMLTVLINQFIRIFFQNFNHINDISINIKSYPVFKCTNFYLKSNVIVNTNIIYILISLFERLFSKGGKKNVQEQSN